MSKFDLNLWGKLKGDLTHAAICHCLDVGAVAWTIWPLLSKNFRKILCKCLRVDDSEMRKLFAFLASIHDLGKLSPAFQKKVEQISEEIWTYLKNNYDFTNAKDSRHNLITQFLLPKLAEEIFNDPELLFCFSIILGGHHGRFSEQPRGVEFKIDSGMCENTKDGKKSWKEQQKLCFDFLVDFWGIKNVKKITHPERWCQGGLLVLSGLVVLCDWIGSSSIPQSGVPQNEWELCFPMSGNNVDVYEYAKKTKDRAKYVIEKLGISSFEFNQAKTFRELYDFTPNDLQCKCDEAFEIIKKNNEPCLIFVESNTGSGKTEAAGYLGQLCGNHFKHNGMTVLLPTCATADQGYKRYVKLFEKLLGPEKHIGVQLMHAMSRLSLDNMGKDEDLRNSIFFNEWLGQSNRTKLFDALGVGTIDQAAMAVIQTKFFPLRLIGLVNKVIILDEVHCYDIFTSQIVRQLIQWLGFLGSTVIVLSATLSKDARESLAGAWRGRKKLDIVSNVKYPRITVVQRWGEIKDACQSVPVCCNDNSFVVSRIDSGNEAMVKSLKKKLKNGGNIVVFKTLVAEVQEAYEYAKLHFKEDEIYILHARTCPAWRQIDEDKIVKMFGKNGQRPHRAIVFATGLLEQSLDLDFDCVYSDLVPIDILMQRMGRCHRHDNIREKSFEKSILVLMCDKVDRDNVSEHGKHNLIYNKSILQRTYETLIRKNVRKANIPGDVEYLIEKVYGNLDVKRLSKERQKHLKEAHEKRKDSESRLIKKAIWNMIPNPTCKRGLFEPLFEGNLSNDNEDLLQSTTVPLEDKPLHIGYRAGASVRNIPPSVRVVFVKKTDDGKWMLPVKNVGETPVIFDPNEKCNVFIKQIADSAITIINDKVVEYCKNMEIPEGWDNTPIVRYLKPIVMDNDGSVIVNGIYFKLSRILGLEINTHA